MPRQDKVVEDGVGCRGQSVKCKGQGSRHVCRDRTRWWKMVWGVGRKVQSVKCKGWGESACMPRQECKNYRSVSNLLRSPLFVAESSVNGAGSNSVILCSQLNLSVNGAGNNSVINKKELNQNQLFFVCSFVCSFVNSFVAILLPIMFALSA